VIILLYKDKNYWWILGFKSLPKYSSDDFFSVISKRYEQASTIITTNKDFDAWNDIFENPVFTKATVDRAMHHAEVFHIKGMSYRTRARNQIKNEAKVG
jgi:DNA replication protein DnaC